MSHGGFAHRAFEEKHLVSQTQRVVVEEVDFHLTGTHLVNQGVHVQPHLVAVVVNFFEQRVELVHRVNAVSLSGRFGATTAANRGVQQRVGVGVACHQVELEFRGDHGFQAHLGVQIANPAQHTARREGDQFTVAVITVVDDLRRWVRGPGHDAHRAGIGLQMHVTVVRVDDVVVGAGFWKFTGHAQRHHHFGQAHAPVLGEFDARQDFSAGHAGQVGGQAFHFGDAVNIQPIFQFAEVGGCGQGTVVGHGNKGGLKRGQARAGVIVKRCANRCWHAWPKAWKMRR